MGFYEYTAALGDPSGRQSSAINVGPVKWNKGEMIMSKRNKRENLKMLRILKMLELKIIAPF